MVVSLYRHMQLDSYLSEKHHRRKKRRQYLYFGAGAVGICLMIVLAGWILFKSPLFREQGIEVEGNAMVPSDEVVSLLQSAALSDHSWFKSMLGINNLLIWPSSLPVAQLAMEPRLTDVTISKNYFSRTLTAHVTERAAVAIWCFVGGGSAEGSVGAGATQGQGETCYWFDADGFIFSRALDVQGGALYSIHDDSQQPGNLGDHVLPAPFIPNLIAILNVLHESNVGVQDITLKDLSLQEIAVTTNGGPMIYFSLRFPATEDLQVLQNLMSQPGFAKLSYIDFRVENRAYYK